MYYTWAEFSTLDVYLCNVHCISDKSFADAGSYNITILPTHMPVACQQFVFWKEGVREETKREIIVYRMIGDSKMSFLVQFKFITEDFYPTHTQIKIIN